jgi:predicted nucleic acid-binding protein
MIYFDSDVLVNYFVEQDPQKHVEAAQHYKNATAAGTFCCSLLALQETSYVLSRLNVEARKIEIMLRKNFPYLTTAYKVSHFNRAIEIAEKIGFQHINDCLHTAIAEEYCQELLTYNKTDFKRIQKHPKLKITIL